jgi:hypothetical protein
MNRGIGSTLTISASYIQIQWFSMEWVVLIVVVIAVVAVFTLVARTTALLVGLAVNALVGLIVLFLTNLFLEDNIPITLLTILICAIGGVVGWLIILVLHLLRIAF